MRRHTLQQFPLGRSGEKYLDPRGAGPGEQGSRPRVSMAYETLVKPDNAFSIRPRPDPAQGLEPSSARIVHITRTRKRPEYDRNATGMKDARRHRQGSPRPPPRRHIGARRRRYRRHPPQRSSCQCHPARNGQHVPSPPRNPGTAQPRRLHRHTPPPPVPGDISATGGGQPTIARLKANAPATCPDALQHTANRRCRRRQGRARRPHSPVQDRAPTQPHRHSHPPPKRTGTPASAKGQPRRRPAQRQNQHPGQDSTCRPAPPHPQECKMYFSNGDDAPPPPSPPARQCTRPIGAMYPPTGTRVKYIRLLHPR